MKYLLVILITVMMGCNTTDSVKYSNNWTDNDNTIEAVAITSGNTVDGFMVDWQSITINGIVYNVHHIAGNVITLSLDGVDVYCLSTKGFYNHKEVVAIDIALQAGLMDGEEVSYQYYKLIRQQR